MHPTLVVELGGFSGNVRKTSVSLLTESPLGDSALNDTRATAGPAQIVAQKTCPQNGLKPFGLDPAAMSLRERRCATALSAVKLPKLRETRRCGAWLCIADLEIKIKHVDRSRLSPSEW